MRRKRILVPRFVDAAQHNAQNLNVKAMLPRFHHEELEWLVTYYHEPDRALCESPTIRLIRLWRWRFWKARMFLFYLQPADALFYPGGEAVDAAGWCWRKRLYPDSPIIATMEGLAGTEDRERLLSELAGHPVYCQRVSEKVMKRLDDRLYKADNVIAISPFLAKIGRALYGDKFSVLPLGVDQSLFYPGKASNRARLRVAAAGRVECHKRPEVFLELARRYPQADFVWYGEGDMRPGLIAQAKQQGLTNLSFPGALPPHLLGEAFRVADLFVMPSKSEGVPKVSQEAAACGLAQVIFGYYEAPSVVDKQNGFVVWSDEAFMEKVGELIDNPLLVEAFGKAGAEMALAWDWAVVARQWRELVAGLIRK